MQENCTGTTFVTCLRPTPYKDMHLGHAWTAWHNWKISAGMGGRFLLILDDCHYRLQRCDKNPGGDRLRMDECEPRYVEALEWIGCPPDAVCYSSQAHDFLKECADKLDIREPQITMPETYYGIMFKRIGKFGNEILQYTPWTTLSGVVDHRFFGVTGFVRGWDLVGESFMYDYLCTQLGWVAPEQWYIPVVRRGWSFTKETTSGGLQVPSILELKAAGVTGEEIIQTLRELDWQREQQSRDCINIPLDVLNKPTRPRTIPYHEN
jgi:glutamyl/glutaminyl-tRNA synthetase